VAIGFFWLYTAKGEDLPVGHVIDVWAGNTNFSINVEVTSDKHTRKATPGMELFDQDSVTARANSYATLKLTNNTILRVFQLSRLQVHAQSLKDASFGLLQGAVYVFSRGDRPSSFSGRSVHGATKGTEFLIEILSNADLRISVFDGVVCVTNQYGNESAWAGQGIMVTSNARPTLIPVLKTDRIVQWWLHYPAVLYPGDLHFSDAEVSSLFNSLQSYTNGDLISAFEQFPADIPKSDAVKIYQASLHLALSQPGMALDLLSTVHTNIANSLSNIVLMVTHQTNTSTNLGDTVTAKLVRSYILQSDFKLEEARDEALAATTNGSHFGLAWARLGELEFCRGDTRAAMNDLTRAIQLSPKLAYAHALRGFLFAARNSLSDAIAEFNLAIAEHGNLGDAWLGRGLCRIRSGDSDGGRSDILTATAMETDRSIMHAYLGKAEADAGDTNHAFADFAQAVKLDSRDPTSSLYKALEFNRENRINQAVDSLEDSLSLADNRLVYRSRYLLDEDRAVRSASLASIYQRAGLDDFAMREADRAISDDYLDYSAHQFLAEDYDSLRDPARENLRYETPWSVEYLLANLLAPIGAGPLSQQITPQEYSRLFTVDAPGFTTDTTIRSDSERHELSSFFGVWDKTDWALDLDYLHDNGERLNERLSSLEWTTRIKQQITPYDTALLLTKYYDFSSGDLRQVSTAEIHPALTQDESQTPLALLGWHHQWAPGVDTLFLGGRLQDDNRLSDTNFDRYLIYENKIHSVPVLLPFTINYQSDLDIYTAEINHIIDLDPTLTIAGGRYQSGNFTSENTMTVMNPTYSGTDASGSFRESFERSTLYLYETLRVYRELKLTLGFAYDRVTSPTDFRDPPVGPGTTSVHQLSPKAAVVWPLPNNVTLRAAYAQSLGGASFDESFRLEPGQLAGFNQSYRSLISESVAGSVTAPETGISGIALDVKPRPRTYLGFTFNDANLTVYREIGVFRYSDGSPAPYTSMTLQNLAYHERSLLLTASQLVGDYWSFGAKWQTIWADLKLHYPESRLNFYEPDQEIRSTLSQPSLWAVINAPNGFFARADGIWFLQGNATRNYDDPSFSFDDSYPELNLTVGWRFPKQRGEASVGVLNALGEGNHLSPLTVYTDQPHERVWYARVKLSF